MLRLKYEDNQIENANSCAYYFDYFEFWIIVIDFNEFFFLLRNLNVYY